MVVAQLVELRLGERFCGPPATANGGYACGAIAELLGDGVEVTLRRPPPLGRPLRLQVGGLAADRRFFPNGDAFRGLRVHQTRLQGGDASSDSYCYTR